MTETPDALLALGDRRVGFIGCGAMAQALAGGLVAAGLETGRLIGADPVQAQRDQWTKTLGVEAVDEAGALLGQCDVVVLCVKPGIVPAVLADVADQPDATRPLWISIAAGVTHAHLAGALPRGARIVRTMPNTPALVGAGATALFAGPGVEPDELAAAEALFGAVGLTWVCPDEGLLDAVTGLSGSGPAYVFLVLEALGDAGVRQGLPRDAAYQLAFQTVFGAAKLALESGLHPGALKDQVTSPGGTTIAGLERLEAGGVRAALHDAVAAATARSRELGRD
ncbi:MAG: pyrroline-5-carboxylate reductase [Actinomycetota bacterium]|nr:pyrroline-5-carboxylate reductase [Actinomycetota bacterium]